MPYGVLIVTGGMSHQENYARGFQADPRCRIAAVADEAQVTERRARLNQRLAGELGVPYLPDLDEALRLPNIDLVSICTEHDRQGRVALVCAEAGKHIYIDKPLAGSLDEARRLEETIRRKKLKSQMFTTLHQPPARRVLRAAARGDVGELRAIHCDLFFAKGHPAAVPLARRKETTTPAPGAFLVPEAKREMFNIAVYALALIRAAGARKPFRTVHAVTGNYFFETNRRRDMEDFGVLALSLDGGIAATIACGRTGWRSHPGAGHHRTRLAGSRGSILIDAFSARGEITSQSQSWWRVPAENPEDPMGFWASTDQRKTGGPEWTLTAPPVLSDQSVFLDCLDRNKEAECTVADGVRILEALFAAYRSAASGDVVTLA